MHKLLLIISALVLLKANAQTTFKMQQFHFSSQQQPLTMAYVYEKAKERRTGKTVLLLHGKNFSLLYWKKTMDALLSKGYDVLAPDQIGFGQSSMPQQYQFSFQQLAYNTHLLADSLGIKNPVVLGHSIGGMLAVRYALLYPNECSQLILEDPIGLEDWKLYIPYTPIDSSFKTELNKTKASLKQYMLNNYFHRQWKNNYDTLLEQSSINLGNKASAWCQALTTDMMFTQPVLYEFSQVKVPTTLIIGALDRTAPEKEKAASPVKETLGNYPKLATAAAALIPACKLIILKDIGHVPHEEDFNGFIKTLIQILH